MTDTAENLIRIVLAEDNPGDARLLAETLYDCRGGLFQLMHEESLAGALERLATEKVDVLLLDLSLPDSNGLETVSRAHEHAGLVPIIVLTGTDDEAIGAEAIHRGAQDYLVKGQVDARTILRAIRYATQRKRSEAALQNSLRRFELLAQTAGGLLQAAEPQKVVESLCWRVMEQLDCHAFFNFLVDDEAQRLHLNACAGIPEEQARQIEWLDYGAAVCGCAARDSCRIVAEHIPATPDPRTDLVKSYGIKAYACHPLLAPGGKVIGTLSFGTRGRETFSADDLSLMKAVADQVAVAMGRIRSEEALRQSEQRRRVAEAVQAERQRFNNILEMLPAFLVLLSPDHHVPFANRAFRQRFGEPNGRRCYECLFEGDKPCEPCPALSILNTDEQAHWEWTDPDGRAYEVHAFPFTDADGSPLILEMGLDITERKRAEAALKDLNETLEQRADQLRTLAAQLTQAEQKERQRLATILHDHLQQLLVGTKFHLGMLRSQGNEPEIRELIDQVDSLLDQSLETSRNLTVDLSPPILTHGNMSQVLRWLADWMRSKHGLAVTVSAEEEANPQAHEVKVLLFQATRELLFNIVKHAQVEQATVELCRLDGRQAARDGPRQGGRLRAFAVSGQGA